MSQWATQAQCGGPSEHLTGTRASVKRGKKLPPNYEEAAKREGKVCTANTTQGLPKSLCPNSHVSRDASLKSQ